MQDFLLQKIYDRLEDEGLFFAKAPESYTLLDALAREAVSFEIENWYAFSVAPLDEGDQTLPAKMLMRAYDRNNDRIAHEKAIGPLYETGLAPEIDALVVTAALAQAQCESTFPVSVNIAPESAVSEKFWSMMAPILMQYDEKDMVFEILERDVPKDANLAVLEKMKAKGYRFALDDVLYDSQSQDRLAFFGPHVDFVKIDGSAIRHEFDTGGRLTHLVGMIRNNVPHAHLIAEWVHSAKEALTLNEKFRISTVQGASLGMSFIPAARETETPALPARFKL